MIVHKGGEGGASEGQHNARDKFVVIHAQFAFHGLWLQLPIDFDDLLGYKRML